MDETDTNVLLVFIGLTIPLAILWFWLFKRVKHKFKTLLNYSVLVFASMILLYVYFFLILSISNYVSTGSLNNLISITAFVTLLCINLVLIPTVLWTLLLTLIWLAGRRKKH
jgi:phosphatidylserine synthase